MNPKVKPIPDGLHFVTPCLPTISRTCLFILLGILVTQFASAKDLRLFNTEVLGKSLDEAVTLLARGNTNAITPQLIQVDAGSGQIYAAKVTYPRSVTVEEAREALNSIYKDYERSKMIRKNKMGAWRSEEQKLSIMLTYDEEEEAVVVVYILLGKIPGDVMGRALGTAFKKMEEKQKATDLKK